MNEMPEVLLGFIFEYLPIHDLFFSISCVSTYLHNICKSRYLLNTLLKHQLDSLIIFSLSPHKSLKILKRIHKHLNISELDFLGFGTTGGVDDDLSCYWVGNLFKNDSSTYCSRTEKNINTVAVLKSSQHTEYTSDQLYARKIAARIIRKNPILSRLLESRPKMNSALLPLEERLFLQSWNENRELIDLSALDYSEKTKRKVYKVLSENQLNMSSLYQESSHNLLLKDINHKSVSRYPKVAAIHKIEVSTIGQFSCPLAVFLIFVSDEYLQIDGEELKMYDSMKEYSDLIRLAELDKSVPEITCLKEYKNLEYCCFGKSKSKLRPVVWGRFKDNSPSLGEVSLDRYYSGRYLYAKLIDCHNRMQEMHDHHLTNNIDCTSIIAYGFEIKTRNNSNIE